MEELESSWMNARKGKGGSICFLTFDLSSHWPVEKSHGLETEDLLVANPNRGLIFDSGGEEEDEPSKSDSERSEKQASVPATHLNNK
jgi:hypothetical protein